MGVYSLLRDLEGSIHPLENSAAFPPISVFRLDHDDETGEVNIIRDFVHTEDVA